MKARRRKVKAEAVEPAYSEGGPLRLFTLLDFLFSPDGGELHRKVINWRVESNPKVEFHTAEGEVKLASAYIREDGVLCVDLEEA